jgi:alpha-tubulin suppressor-like RCC1 family protein
MKKIINLFFTGTLILLAVNINAQVNRKDTKKSVPYRANYQRMAAGFMAECSFEIRKGALYAWGDNRYGQLGDGTTTNRTSPVHIGSDDKWVTISVGNKHTLGIKSDGTLWAWGRNGDGQLGDGTTTNRTSPVQIGSGTKWVCISAGDDHSLGLKADGTLWAWGDNATGELGDGTTTTRTSPVQIGSNQKWTSISAGSDYSLGLRSTGGAWAWGKNSSGQLGIGNTNNQTTGPVSVGADNDWVSIVASIKHSHGMKSNGKLYSWGDNTLGVLGDGTTNQRTSPVQVGSDNHWVSVSVDSSSCLGLKSNGTLWAWGLNDKGQLGNGNTTNQTTGPIQVGSNKTWVSISTGKIYNLGLKADGSLWAWGANGYGEYGDGTTNEQHSPTQIRVDSSMTISISAGPVHGLGLRSDGTIWGWGLNKYGALGVGDTIERDAPVKIGSDKDWISISAGGGHGLALKSNGTLWAWGVNSQGQLGNGTTTDQLSPIQIGSDTDWVSISADYGANHALKSDGTMWAWGFNLYGRLGDGTQNDQHSPVKIGSCSTWVSISSGQMHGLGLRSDGTVWGWGYNAFGSVGDGTSGSDRYDPVQEHDLDDAWIAIDAGIWNSMALKADGSLHTWGVGTNGQVGYNDLFQSSSRPQILSGDTWIDIATGSIHDHALKADGTLWAWGGDSGGQLGDGSYTDMGHPEQIGTSHFWVDISAGTGFSYGLQVDRDQFCSTGWNNYGQLGDGTTSDKNSYGCNSNGGNTLRIGNISNTDETLNYQNPFIIYPNPNNGIFTIKSSSEGQFSILNKYGQTVQSLILNSSNDFSVNVENLSNGLYLIVGSNSDQKNNQKIIVIK